LGRGVVGDLEDQGAAVDLLRDALGRGAHLVGDQEARAFFREAPADRGADGAPAAGDEDRLHFGRLSMTRFALQIERSIAPMRTSLLMPTYDLMCCCS